ncbi:MAG: hypothetical protein GJU74_07685 [Metallibacterium scheffleri]|jgi:hypothetical protein|uniref:hypothetical protein n=1 Tax=Metallibacterium sp. TaxID=2940281 RepID=UPI00260EB43C|nr:hypothetical protein [Metallibacterium sp.]MBW8075248.1 hypothetical protein [Metallibacterium scheffleri]
MVVPLEHAQILVAGVVTAASAAGSLTEYAEAIMRATAAGEVAPDIAASLLSALAQLGRLRALDELERRLVALEKAREA